MNENHALNGPLYPKIIWRKGWIASLKGLGNTNNNMKCDQNGSNTLKDKLKSEQGITCLIISKRFS